MPENINEGHNRNVEMCNLVSLPQISPSFGCFDRLMVKQYRKLASVTYTLALMMCHKPLGIRANFLKVDVLATCDLTVSLFFVSFKRFSEAVLIRKGS